jgi:hypothetical protein
VPVFRLCEGEVARVGPGGGAGLRQARRPATAEEIEAFETDVLAGFVLARSAAGLSDDTIRGDVSHLDQVRTWFGRPL